VSQELVQLAMDMCYINTNNSYFAMVKELDRIVADSTYMGSRGLAYASSLLYAATIGTLESSAVGSVLSAIDQVTSFYCYHSYVPFLYDL
jgi:hypothetical protein